MPQAKPYFQPEQCAEIEKLALVILAKMVHGDTTDPVLLGAASRLNERYQAPGWAQAMTYWIAAMLAAMHAPRAGEDNVVIGTIDPVTGQMSEGVEGLCPEEAWAWQLISAQRAGDQDMFTALLSAVAEEHLETHIKAVLLTCAVNISVYQRMAGKGIR